ncbi:MAG: ankyrin repeat domain-containing protein [Candidatus Babeliales bacterium]
MHKYYIFYLAASLVSVNFGMDETSEKPKSLLDAAGQGSLMHVQEFCNNGANVNQRGKYGHTPLEKAFLGNHLDIAQFLIENGADVNQSGQYFTPLFQAIQKDSLDAVKFLIAQGANVNQPCNDDTGLRLAAGRGCLDIVQFLVAKGAEVNPLPTKYGKQTPLLSALENGHLEVAAYLLAHGADIKIPLGKVKGLIATENLKKLLQEGKSAIDRENFKNGLKNEDLDYHKDAINSLTKNLKELAEEFINNKFFIPLEQQSLLTLCCTRELCQNSLFYKDFLPSDIFKIIIKQAEILALSNVQATELVSFFREIEYEQTDPDFMQKLEEYKNKR